MLANPSSSSRRTKVLLTGGAGYVGSILIPRLRADGYEVRVLDNLMYSANGLFAHFMDPGFEFVRGQVRSKRCEIHSLVGKWSGSFGRNTIGHKWSISMRNSRRYAKDGFLRRAWGD